VEGGILYLSGSTFGLFPRSEQAFWGESQYKGEKMYRSLPMILVRIVVGLVFLTEGVLKFLRPNELGVGRFAALGFPFPHILAPLAGCAELLGGTAILLSLYAGDAALLLLAVIVTAIVTTKVPILLGHPLGPFVPMKTTLTGWMGFLHEARVDLSMLFCLVAILIESGLHLGRRRPWYQSKGL
jgi:uncharacterized membrane protein YphA (DoxX/SURF4 family)